MYSWFYCTFDNSSSSGTLNSSEAAYDFGRLVCLIAHNFKCDSVVKVTINSFAWYCVLPWLQESVK